MSGGPRVTTGTDSKQDYGTDLALMAAVSERFGEVQFDLAAHRLNTKHPRYFAPPNFVEKVDLAAQSNESIRVLVESLIQRGVHETDALAAEKLLREKKASGCIEKNFLLTVPNSDVEAHGIDAFSFNWAAISRQYGKPGLLWLNCEFNDTTTWMRKCGQSVDAGANIAAIMPAMVGANWARDLIFPKASVYFLNGRVSFDGKNVYPKDCMIAHFHPDVWPGIHVWDWRKNKIVHSYYRALAALKSI